MLRKTLLYLSNQQRVFTFVRRNRLARRMASRFVAGETIDEAIPAVRALNARGITASLDLLGESVHHEEEARATARSYLEILDRINAEKLDANPPDVRASTFSVVPEERRHRAAELSATHRCRCRARESSRMPGPDL